jgi:molybdopterin synthase catalytic subunit
MKSVHNDTVSKIAFVSVTTDVISARALSELVSTPAAGAVVSFSGDVRDNDDGRKVTALLYEAHPNAQLVLEKVAQEIATKYSVERVAVAHRHGPIPIGESALAACVSAKHRDSAFEACQELVDEVKRQIPIWKYQTFADGTDEWVNCA